MLTGLLLLTIDAQTGGEQVTGIFLQYGVVGAVALIFMAVAYKLFTNLVATHNAAMERVEAAYGKEVIRGDRLEKELADLNKLINTSLAGELVRATDAIREALEIMHDRRRQ